MCSEYSSNWSIKSCGHQVIMMENCDTHTEEYFSLPSLREIEAIHNWNYNGRENIDNVSKNYLNLNTTDREKMGVNGRVMCPQQSDDEEVNDGGQNCIYPKEIFVGKTLKKVCTTSNLHNNDEGSNINLVEDSTDNTQLIETTEPYSKAAASSRDSFYESFPDTPIEMKARSSSENDATSAATMKDDTSISSKTIVSLQRPTSLPLGSPPSYTEALRCSPQMMNSLPYDINCSRSRTSLYALDTSLPYINSIDPYLDIDPGYSKNGSRLIAVPSIHTIHTITRSNFTTPCVTPDDGIIQQSIVTATVGFENHPCAAFCKGCQITVLTTTSSRYKSFTYCCCFLMFFSGVCCPFSFFPFLFCGPKKVYHLCPQCKETLGVFVGKD